MVRLAAFAMLALAVPGAQAQNPPPATAWYHVSHVELDVVNSSGEFAASWQFDRADNGDIRITKQEQRGATKVSGTLMSVCDNQALLFKDIVPVRNRELKELDEPVLHLQLALGLLARALPQGPLAAGAKTDIDLGEQKNPIRVRKGNAVRRDFLAPWHVRGNVEHATPDSIRFDLAFSYAGVDATERRDEMKMSGVWQQKTRTPSFDNAYAITDWQVYRVGIDVSYAGGNAQLVPLVISRPQRFKTLGELRTRIEHVWSEDRKARKQMDCEL